MAYCSLCGVKVEENRRGCPLCKAPIQYAEEPSDTYTPQWPKTVSRQPFSKRERLFLIWLPLTLTLGVAFLIIFLIDLMQDRAITWSLYPLTAIGATALSITAIVLFYKKWIYLIGSVTAITLLQLYFIDSFNGIMGWFFPLALPITLMVSLHWSISHILYNLLQKRISYLISLQFFQLALLSLTIDWIIKLSWGERSLGWSLIVAVVLVACAILGAFYILFVRKRIDLAKYFHY